MDRFSRAPVMAAAGAVLLWGAVTLGSSDPLTYQGGFLVVGLAAAVLVAGAAGAASAPAARVLSARPLAYLGRISYGMYLWYFPLFAYLDHARTGLSGPALFGLRCGADVAVAVASFHLVEQPVRRWRPALHPARWAAAHLGAGAAAAAAVASLVVLDTPAAYSMATGPVAALAAPGPVPGAGLRILVVGDSTAATLGMDLAWPDVERHYGYMVDDRATFGCGMVISASVLEQGQPTSPAPPCDVHTPATGQWPALLRADLARFHPDVVIVAGGRWEVQSRRATDGGPWVQIGQPADASYVHDQLDEAASIVLAGPATLALATAPCFSSGEQPDGSAWPEDSPKRLAAYNGIVRQVVAAHPGRARLLDLDAMVCPGGRYRSSLGAIPLRAPDGVHYPFFNIGAPDAPDPDTVAECRSFGAWLAPRVLQAVSG
ncbi:MAG TPA: hypothetical protein VKI19_12090, partial [Acidimicrobiales bacterium]|nr:hypothetical protein [Acidimicrobiales bacterium]